MTRVELARQSDRLPIRVSRSPGAATQGDFFKDFTWKITCNSIHNIFITDNFFIIDFKRSHTYKVYIPIPGDHFYPSDHFIVIFDKNVC